MLSMRRDRDHGHGSLSAPRQTPVDAVLAAVAQPEVRVVLVTGEPGLGKSRLLESVADALHADRAWGLRPLAEVPLSTLTHLVAPAKTRTELIRALLARVGAVICVDDLPEADALSQSLLERLSAEPGRTIIATVRTEDGRLPAQLELLAAHPSTRIIPLSALDRQESDALVRAELDGEVETRLLDELWTRTHGNPLFTLQVLRAARESGAIERTGSRWIVTARLPVPMSLRHALLARLDALAPEGREAAEFLAGLGRVPVQRFEITRRATALRLLVGSGLVTIADRADARGALAVFASPLLAEVVWEGMDTLRRRTVLAEHLHAERAEPQPDSVTIAVLSLELKSPTSAAELMPAVRLAAGGFDADVVLRFTTAAIAEARGDDLEEVVRAEAGAYVQLGRVEDAFAVIETALRRVRPGRVAVRLALLLNELMIWAGGDQPGAARMLSSQRRRYPRWIRLPRAAFAVAEADGLVFAGKHIEALALLDTDARPWPRMDRELAVARSTVRAHALAQRGDIAAAMTELASAELTANRPEEIAPVLRSILQSLWGRPADGERIGREAYRVAVDAGFEQGTAFAALVIAVASAQLGDIRAAAEWSDRAIASAETAGMADVLRLGLLQRASAEAALAEHVDPLTLERLAAVPGGVGFFRHQLPLASAWAARITGDCERTDEIMADAVRAAREGSAGASEALLLHEWMRMGRRGLSAQLMALPQGYPLMEARLLLARGLDTDDAALLETASERFEQLGMVLFAAEADAAAAKHAEGNARKALSLHAQRLAASVGSPTTPLLAELPERKPLTRREQQIAALAREATNPEIAEMLHLSVRTIENHLARVFRKLGISSRTEIPTNVAP